MRATGDFLCRFVILATAIAALVWAGGVFMLFGNSSKLNPIANRLMSGDSFSSSMPSNTDLKVAESRELCDALEVRAATIVRLRLYEDAVAKSDVPAANSRMKELEFSVRRSLACAPTEAFLWFIRYWMLLARGEPVSDQLRILAMSYRLGPNEGWIALRRNVYALAVYGLLPDNIQSEVRHEFASLVHAGFLNQAAQNLSGAGWPIRDQLLPELAWTNVMMRQQFDRMLWRDGVDVKIPGVERRELPLFR